MSDNNFFAACAAGDEREAKIMVERDPGIINKQDNINGSTGLMWALLKRRHSFTRWLLSLPGLNINIRNENKDIALEHAVTWDAPLDIMITLIKLSSWQTVNQKDSNGLTALDWAVLKNNTGLALYLSWLGAECGKENRKYKKVTWDTWVSEVMRSPEKGKQLFIESQYWAVAANDKKALRRVARVVIKRKQLEKLEREKLRTLAKLFRRRKICSVWGDIPGLQSLAWEELQQTTPALTTLPVLLKQVPSHVVGVLVKCAT